MSDVGNLLLGFKFEVTFTVGSITDEACDTTPKAHCSGSFSEVTGLESSMEPKVIKEGGRNYGVIQRAGPVTFATVVLKRGMTSARDLWKWFDLIGRGKYAKRLNVRITMRDQHGDPVLIWLVRRALPVKFKAGDLNAQGNGVAIEELHLAHEGLEFQAAGGAPGAGEAKGAA